MTTGARIHNGRAFVVFRWRKLERGRYETDGLPGIGCYRVTRTFAGGGSALWNIEHCPEDSDRYRPMPPPDDQAISLRLAQMMCVDHARSVAGS